MKCYYFPGRDALSTQLVTKTLVGLLLKDHGINLAAGKTMLRMNSRPSALDERKLLLLHIKCREYFNRKHYNIKIIYKLESSI